MEYSQRTTVKNRLAQNYGIVFSKKDLYRAVCAFNDSDIRIGTFPDMIEELYYSEESMARFVNYLINQYKPKSQYEHC